jgi:hypothetical protein
MRFQACLGNTTYTIEDEPNGIVRLSRFNPPNGTKVAESAQLFVPVSLIVEYVVARIAPRISRMLIQLGED